MMDLLIDGLRITQRGFVIFDARRESDDWIDEMMNFLGQC
jgi:hypothetical protein